MFPVQCYSPKSLPVPFPSPLRHVQEQCADLAPFPHHPLVPQPLHVAALHWNYPHQGRQSHWITKPLSSYVSLSSIQKTLWRAHHAPGGSPIPRLLPPLGGLGFSHTCTTAFPGSLALLWLLLQPYHNPPKEGSPGFCPWSLSSLFSDICSPDFKVYFCKWSPNLYLQWLNMFQSKPTILHLKSDSYSLLLCFCSWHSLNFPGLKPQHYLGFPPCPSALHPID